MNYDQAMKALNEAIYKAVRCANRERKPVTALSEMAYDIDHIIDHGMTREEMRHIKKAQKQLKEQWSNK